MEIGVVLVTFNRLEKLKIALEAYERQTVKPKYILVVDNNSTDGTREYLENWKKEEKQYKKYTVFMEKNTGGSGGFYEALKHSLELDASWIWTADDDAYPKEDAFEVAIRYLKEKEEKNQLDNISAICGTVFKADGKTIDYSHRRRIYTSYCNRIKQPYSKQKDYEKEEFEIEGFSYVGTFINKEKMKQLPLTKKDYFIYYDDTEHSYRLSKIGKIICVPKIQVVHDAPHSDMSSIVKWKLYYLVRNTLDFIKNNFDEKYFKVACIEVPIKFKIAVLLFGKEKKKGYAMIKEALKDAKIGKTGLHEIYKPGWK